MKRIIQIILDKKIVLSIFLAVHLLGVIWLLVTGENTENQNIPYEKLLLLKSFSFLTYVLLVFLTLKNIKLVTWLMAAALLLTGIGSTPQLLQPLASLFQARPAELELVLAARGSNYSCTLQGSRRIQCRGRVYIP